MRFKIFLSVYVAREGCKLRAGDFFSVTIERCSLNKNALRDFLIAREKQKTIELPLWDKNHTFSTLAQETQWIKSQRKTIEIQRVLGCRFDYEKLVTCINFHGALTTRLF